MLTLNDGRSELWQWDTGRTVSVDADCSQVHFSNKIFGRSIDVDVVDGVAIIPDILLQTDKDLNVWAFVGTAENGYTKISKTFKVNRRNKPADYVFTPPDQTSLEEIKEKIEYLESIQDPDAIKNAVEDYLEQNPGEAPVQSVNGKTGTVELTAEDVGAISNETDPTVPAWAKQPQKPTYTASEVGALPYTYTPPIATETTLGGVKAAAATDDMTQPVGITADGKLVTAPSPDSGGNADQGTGWTSEQIDILDSIGDHINFLDAEGGRLWDSLIAALRRGQGSSAVLTSITAVYSGGSVEAGTQTRELKITVTATYDDGTSKTVTGYTLSPETVSEGENTVTVTYNGKTSTFTVTGIVTPAEVVLESISAIFNGQNAQTGTNASDLDITVTGHYSDGSTKTETDWTTAGIVAEGENVFTIYLGDKTCTLTVVGVAATEDVGVGAGTKIARFEGQANGSYGMAQIDSSLIEDGKIYAFVLDPGTPVSAYTRISKFSYVFKNANGALVGGTDADGVITFNGANMTRYYPGTYYDLYEIGKDGQVITDGQLFDYVGSIEPTKNSGFENTLTIPASAFTGTVGPIVVLKAYNPEIDYQDKVSTYGRTPYAMFNITDTSCNRVNMVDTGVATMSYTRNDNGSLDIVGSSGVRFYDDANLVYDVYRANPTWG